MKHRWRAKVSTQNGRLTSTAKQKLTLQKKVAKEYSREHKKGKEYLETRKFYHFYFDVTLFFGNLQV